MEYIIGGLVVWIFSGISALYSVSMPFEEDDKFDFPPIKVCLLMLAFGPISSAIAFRIANELHLDLLKKSIGEE